MRLNIFARAFVLFLAALHGCSDEAPSGHDVVEAVAQSAAVSTGVLVLAVQLVDAPPSLADREGHWVDESHLRTVELAVDGQPWGTFEINPSGEASQWVLHEGRKPIVISATLGSALDETERKLNTVGDWRALLAQYIDPGGHVATIERVTLEGPGGTETTIATDAVLPFSTDGLDTTAYFGEVTLTLHGEEIAP